MICETSQHCKIISEITNENDCNTRKEVCVFRNNTYSLVNKDSCESDNNGQCTQYCPPKCSTHNTNNVGVSECGALTLQQCLSCEHNGNCPVDQSTMNCYLNM